MKKVKNNKTKSKKKAMPAKPKNKARVQMGPVTTINTAPVAIGNSVRGARCQSTPTQNGVLVNGRDFMFSPIGSGLVQTWTCVGGAPLTPAAFADSTIRQYMQMYQKFRWKGLVAHYITSSPTSANGDVLFYRAKNRGNVFLSQTSPQLLPLVISDPDTVLGPQWTNHSARMQVTSSWKSTDYGMTDDLEEYADGELFLLSKTSTTDSPGYVLFDYQIEFAEMQITPRLLALPLPRILYSQANITISGAVSTSTPATFNFGGNNITGTASTVPTGMTQGDIYKMIIDVTNSAPASWVNVNATNLFKVRTTSGNVVGDTNFTTVDGTTIYAIAATASSLFLCTSSSGAYVGLPNIYFNVGATITANLQVWLSLVGTANTTNISPNY
jgi:hypothetical protein